ncbi:MAG: potassium channel family protein [Phenylobacterium sp.]
MGLLTQLAVSTGMAALTALIHLAGLASLVALLQDHGARLRTPHVRIDQAVLVLIAVFSIFLLHAVEIWLYAALFVGVGDIHNFEDALYYSTTTYATIGDAEVTPTRDWRLVGAIEGINGIILLGWSTAFFVSIVRRLGVLERRR